LLFAPTDRADLDRASGLGLRLWSSGASALASVRRRCAAEALRRSRRRL